ncbi:MAG: glutamine synthetase family protein, partial [Pseudomonadota bacterium]
GADVPASHIAMEIGDPDGPFVPIPETLSPVPASFGSPSAGTLAVLQGMIGAPDGNALSPYDPRAALCRVINTAKARGFTPVVALEIEFYLIDPAIAAPANHPLSNRRLDRLQMLDLDLLSAFEPVLADIEAGAVSLGLPTGSVLSEFGAGQFEVNLAHTDDAARACDQLIALKRLVRSAARRHGLDATFMAKPFDEWSGSGLHCHMSILDPGGRNIFDAPGEPVATTLGAAIAGVVATAAGTHLVHAPHLNSYRRHQPGSYAPATCNWGLDNRGAAIRVPARTGPGARFEHRVAGADANPYLVVAALVAGALKGLAETLSPPPPSIAEEGEGPHFPKSWRDAQDAFAASQFAQSVFGAPLVKVFTAMKRQEEATLLGKVTDVEHEAYLRTV